MNWRAGLDILGRLLLFSAVCFGGWGLIALSFYSPLLACVLMCVSAFLFGALV